MTVALHPPDPRAGWEDHSLVMCDSCPTTMCAQVFTLPKVSAKLKLKLTALEGSRVRRVGVAHFGSCRAEDYGEHHLAVLTNLGDIQVVSMPLLKPQVRYSCIRREDVSGIASCVFTKYGQGVEARPGASVRLGEWEGVSGTARDGEPRVSQMWSSVGQALSPSPWEGGPVSATGPRSLGWLSSGLFCLSPGFYLISPSEFERFSLSTKWLVEPRCLVDSTKAKKHNRPSNGNGTGPKMTSSGHVR